jgi:arylsulfatase A-like enzyme
MNSICFSHWCRIFLFALFAVAPAFDFSSNARAQFTVTNRPSAPRRASIIFIQCDGLGYGDLSCYGQTKFQTPNLDKLAAKGIRFANYYAGDAASSPSRAALLLGKDSAHLNQRADVDVPLAANEITVAQILKQSGYHTGLIGEWDLGDDGTSGAPWKKGFDEFAGYFDSSDAENYYADFVWRYDPPHPTSAGFHGKEMLYPNTDGKKSQYIPDLFTTMAFNFCRNNQPDQFNHYRPFFLLLNYSIPRPNTAEAQRTGNGMQVPTDAPYSNESWPQPEKNRAAMIARFDADIGQLLGQLKSVGMESNTVIFFSSDTGPQKGGGCDPKFSGSAGAFRGIRGDLYEGGLRVPMIVRWPGKISTGQVSDFTCAAWDFLPTAVEIARRQSPTNVDGVSILPTLLGKGQTRRKIFYWELRGHELVQAARLDDWKIVRSKADEPWQLYSLKTDPGETQNVADKNPDVIAQFEKLLQNIHDPDSRLSTLLEGH